MDYTKIKIILVEDNEDDANLTILGFKDDGLDKNVILLKDGEEAINFFFYDKEFGGQRFEKGINVILLDLRLPKIDGIEILRQLKSHEKTKDIPVVILTASDSDPTIETCKTLGAASYIVKPVTAEDFKRVVNSLGKFWVEYYRF